MIIFKQKNKNRGVALLFAVMVSAVLMSIGFGVLEVALKEVQFSISARDSNNALFAADVGVECALFYDKNNIAENIFRQPSSGPDAVALLTSATCVDIEILPLNHSTIGSDNKYSFILNNLSNGACSTVEVMKYSTPQADQTTTKINAKGHNRNVGGNCGTSSNVVERELEVKY